MIRSITCVLLLVCVLSTSAQDKKWSIEVSYPVSVNDAFPSSNEGTIGVGVKYRFVQEGKFTLGVSLDGTRFATTVINDSDPVQELKYRDFFFQPRLFAEVPLSQNGKFRLSGGIGWTWLYSKGGVAFLNEFGRVEGGEEWADGLNLNVGLTYDITPSIFVQTQYDLMFLSGVASDRNIGLIKVGGGFRF
ncbi:outer membrane insertion C-terminal signal [Muriicola jejuensis]|uniref:Outer membrane beta-barrel protein n=1 Tax=Muriicola jejuensis TaxID=504488 RepID=A0A6P0U9X7_9FLAO|nr:outer membrane beta-barrel protein [Muriicola jejuensis]NER09837.1 outer membrane beta-barrel protein [Muriicola jejuensis]SMP05301.1 outer membrane insertion C-terminal signal [Muriicola jejuensis]